MKGLHVEVGRAYSRMVEGEDGIELFKTFFLFRYYNDTTKTMK